MERCRSEKAIWTSRNDKAHFVELRAEEQEQADTCAVVRLAWDVGRFDISACPLLEQRRDKGGREAKYKAYEPHCDDPDHGCTGRR